jgi:PAS domain-containing protein
MMNDDTAGDGPYAVDLKTVLALHAIAIDGMAEGLCVLDGELRVVLFNRRLREILDLPRDMVRIGAPLKAVLGATGGPDSGARVLDAEMWRELASMFTHRQPFELDRRTTGGALVRLQFQPVSGGGWVATCAPAKARPAERAEERHIESWRAFFVNSSRGVCMYDADQRLVLHNDRYLQLYGFDVDQIRPGMSHADVVRLAIDAVIQPDPAPGKPDAGQWSIF